MPFIISGRKGHPLKVEPQDPLWIPSFEIKTASTRNLEIVIRDVAEELGRRAKYGWYEVERFDFLQNIINGCKP